VVFGDSVPSGGACECVPFGTLYGAKVAAHTGVRVTTTNLARGGFTSPDVQQELESAAARAALRTATTVLIMVGANDMGHAYWAARSGAPAASTLGPAAREVRDDVVAAVRRIHQLAPRDVRVAVLGYWNVFRDGKVGLATYGADGLALADTATAYTNRALLAAAEETHSRYVPVAQVFKGPDGRRDPTPLLASDGDHPDARGHALLAQAVYGALPAG
jgi:lysophospholipase L1-like esterase